MKVLEKSIQVIDSIAYNVKHTQELNMETLYVKLTLAPQMQLIP